MTSVSVYTRHVPKCVNKADRYYRKCRCPKWLYWSDSKHKNGHVLKSAKTNTWAIAEEEARRKEQELRDVELGKPLPAETGLSVADAVTKFLDNKRSERLNEGTIKKLALIFQKELLDWCGQNGIHFLAHLTAPKLQEWRNTWDAVNNPLTCSKKQERVRGLFLFCHNNGWITSNPARALTKIKVIKKEPDYFTSSDLTKIVDATYVYGKTAVEKQRVRAFINLLRWSGLAIRDAVCLERSSLNSEDGVRIVRAKTNESVFVPLPHEIAEELRNVPDGIKPNPRYFFWSGNGLRKTAVADHQRALRRVFKLADLKHADGTPKRCHAHMFRHTFSIHLLDSGMSVESVAMLLGHSTSRTTEKYYKTHTRITQDRVSAELRTAWKIMEKRID